MGSVYRSMICYNSRLLIPGVGGGGGGVIFNGAWYIILFWWSVKPGMSFPLCAALRGFKLRHV